MKCHLCLKEIQNSESKNQNSVHQAKRSQIQNLRKQINIERTKYNETFENQFPQSILSKSLQNSILCNNLQSKLKFIHNIDEMAKKQNTLSKIKILKQRINEKKILVQRYKQQRNQKLNNINETEKQLQKIKQISLQFNQKPNQLKYQIKQKEQTVKNLNKKVKHHLKQIISHDLSTKLKINKRFRINQQQKLFQIKKVGELDILNYQRLSQSFYQLENIEEIQNKNKTSEKGIHVLFENILCFKIIQSLFNFWLPYPINCSINFNQSKLTNKIEHAKICGHKIIDFGKSAKLSNNIMQFFNQQSLRESMRNQKSNTNDQTPFQQIKPQFDESIQYNKRRYALNKQTINYMQANIQFLSIKYGIKKRPLIFLQTQLISAIQKQFMWKNLVIYSEKRNQCPSNYNSQGYNSMLKQIKIGKLMESLQKTNIQTIIKDEVFSYKMILQAQQQDEQVQKQNDQENSKNETIFNTYFSTFSKYLYPSSSSQQYTAPQSLEYVKSSSTENDKFQLLTPDSQQ